MSDTRKPFESPEWIDFPEPQLVEVEVGTPEKAPVPVDPELVSRVWSSQKGPSLPN